MLLRNRDGIRVSFRLQPERSAATTKAILFVD
jgi:hypothetical protein